MKLKNGIMLLFRSLWKNQIIIWINRCCENVIFVSRFTQQLTFQDEMLNVILRIRYQIRIWINILSRKFDFVSKWPQLLIVQDEVMKFLLIISYRFMIQNDSIWENWVSGKIDQDLNQYLSRKCQFDVKIKITAYCSRRDIERNFENQLSMFLHKRFDEIVFLK